MEPFHDVGDMHKAQKSDVELIEASDNTAKDPRALKVVFNQMPRLVAVPLQAALFFAVDPGGNDDVHALGLGVLNNLVRVVGLVRQQHFGMQPIEQFNHRWESCDWPGVSTKRSGLPRASHTA